MWGLVVFTVFDLIAAQTLFHQLGNPSTGTSLNSPYSLKVGHRSDRNVSLSWQFTKPTNVKLDDVTFVIRVLSNGTLVSKNATRYHVEPLRFLLTDLEPSTAYSATVYAKCEGFVNSDSAETYFTTMMFDWPTPNITKHELKDSDDRVDLTVSWDFNRKWSSQEYIKIELCDPECETIRESAEASQVTLPLDFGFPYTLTVVAVYCANNVELVERSSQTVSGYSPMGKPSRIQGLKKVEEVNHQLRIEWRPPLYPKGPVSYYHFEIFDPEYEFRGTARQPVGTSIMVRVPKLVGKVYEISITPVNVDRENQIHSGPLSYFRFERLEPVPMESVKILEQTTNLIRVQISPSDPEMSITLHVSLSLYWSPVEIDKDVVQVSHLEPYASIRVHAVLCYLHKETDCKYCGGFQNYDFRANTAAPSPVENLRVLEFGDGCYEARWDEPLEKHGPIDGYELTIKHKGNVFYDEVNEEFRRSTKRSFCNPFHAEWGQQSVRVAAFNYDLQNRTIKYQGTAVAAHLPKEERPETLPETLLKIMFIIVCIGSGFLTVYVAFAAERQRRRARLPENVQPLHPGPQPDHAIPEPPPPEPPSPETLPLEDLSPAPRPGVENEESEDSFTSPPEPTVTQNPGPSEPSSGDVNQDMSTAF